VKLISGFQIKLSISVFRKTGKTSEAILLIFQPKKIGRMIFQ